MKCPKCGEPQTGDDAVGKRKLTHGRRNGVSNTRHPDAATISRRRDCWSCGFHWTTLEVIEEPAEIRELAGQKFLSI